MSIYTVLIVSVLCILHSSNAEAPGASGRPAVAWSELSSSTLSLVPNEEFQNITSQQFLSIPLEAWGSVTLNQLIYLPEDICSIFSPAHLQRLSPTLLYQWSTLIDSTPEVCLSKKALRAMSLEHLVFLSFSGAVSDVPATLFEGLTPLMARLIPPELCREFNPLIVSKIPDDALQAMNVECYTEIPAEVWRRIDANKISRMPPAFLHAQLSDEVTKTIVPRLSVLQLRNLPKSFCEHVPPTAFSDEQIRHLPVNCLVSLSILCEASDICMFWNRLSTEQRRALLPFAVVVSKKVDECTNNDASTPQQSTVQPSAAAAPIQDQKPVITPTTSNQQKSESMPVSAPLEQQETRHCDAGGGSDTISGSSAVAVGVIVLVTVIFSMGVTIIAAFLLYRRLDQLSAPTPPYMISGGALESQQYHQLPQGRLSKDLLESVEMQSNIDAGEQSFSESESGGRYSIPSPPSSWTSSFASE